MSFHIILMGVWIPFKCSRTECRLLFRADSISDYSTQYCLNHLQMNMVRCLENRADHPNNEGVSWVGLNWIDYSWQISSPFCSMNYTQWRKIRIRQWYHALNWTVQFTWPHTCEASYSWVTMNVRYICRMWVYSTDGRQEFDQNVMSPDVRCFKLQSGKYWIWAN